MDIITFFAPKGGVGRTTLTAVAASALVEAGKRVVVFDLTDPYLHDPVSDPTTSGLPGTRLQVWGERVERDGFDRDRLSVELIRNLRGFITFSVTAGLQGVDYVLVDTPGRPTDLVEEVLKDSTMIVAPATSGMEAALISDALQTGSLRTSPTYGLVTNAPSREEAGLIQAAFTGIPTFRKPLPQRDLFHRQLHESHLFAMKARNWDDRIALRDARKFGEELMYLCEQASAGFGPASGYGVGEPLVEDDAVAHWRALRARNPTVLA